MGNLDWLAGGYSTGRRRRRRNIAGAYRGEVWRLRRTLRNNNNNNNYHSRPTTTTTSTTFETSEGPSDSLRRTRLHQAAH